MPDYIFDTTVLSNFAAVGRLDLLRDRYRGRAFTTLDVADELRKGVNAAYAYLELVLADIDSADQESWIQVLVPQSTSERRLRARFDERLDAGEASCLALAVTRRLTCVTDDKAARHEATTETVPVTGTVGILIQLVRTDALSLPEANALLADMIQQHYRSPVDRLDELV
jgi:predicted nucleic acid-binding protein